jgi:signal peptidase I
MEWVDAVWVALLVVLPVKTLGVQAFRIPSASMEDSLLTGDYLLVKKYGRGWNGTPGDR